MIGSAGMSECANVSKILEDVNQECNWNQTLLAGLSVAE